MTQDTIDAPITSVTVYPDLARVTRRGSVHLEPGRHRLFVEPLPLSLSADSVRVGGEGAATVLGVDVVRRSHSRPPDRNLAELQERRRRLAAEIATHDDTDTVLQRHIDVLVGYAQRSGVTMARGTDGPAAVGRMAADVEGQLAAVYARRRENTARRQERVDDLAAVDRQLAEPVATDGPDRRAAAVELDVSAAGTVHIELSYVVSGAGWSSTYDIRVDAERLALTWFGLVTQRSGEDWPECELLLSTARPSNTATVPDLDPWYLDRHQPVPYPPASPYGAPMPAMAAGPPPASGGPVTRAMAAVAPPQPVREATATIEAGVSASTYRTARPVAVPADGSAHRATVAAVGLDARLDHVTAPVSAAEAHLRATVVNRSPHTLLPGPAAVFNGGAFVGRTTLETWAPGEEVELALGVDDRIRVERTLVARRSTKATLGSTRRREVEYRTLVTNHTPDPARITVLDQLPVSRDEGIAVRELHLHPAPHERTELGVLTWRFELPPGGVAEVLLGLRIELARGVEVAGWRE